MTNKTHIVFLSVDHLSFYSFALKKINVSSIVDFFGKYSFNFDTFVDDKLIHFKLKYVFSCAQKNWKKLIN